MSIRETTPRFVVTSLAAQQWPAQDLYEKLYCARGEMENRIKEQMCLFADRLSSDEMKANQLRLYFSALAYTLVEALRRLALKGTQWAGAQVDPSAGNCSGSAPSCASACAACARNEFHLSLETPLRPRLLRPALLKPAGLHALALLQHVAGLASAHPYTKYDQKLKPTGSSPTNITSQPKS